MSPESRERADARARALREKAASAGRGKPDDEVTIPHEVVGLHVIQGLSLIRSWRKYLSLTQQDVARRMGVTRPAYARMEATGVRPRVATLKKIAAALGVEWERVRE